MKEKKTLIDIFSGAGGLSCGFSMAGFKPVLGIDNDSFASKTFSKNHHGSKHICEDVEKIDFAVNSEKLNLKNTDIIIGGPPCQGLSLSGPRKLHDPRNKLFLSYVRLTEEILPKAFVLENVPGLVSLFKGKVKDAIIEEFENLGYSVSYKILNAADFGVPQIRKRVFFVGLLNKDEKYIFPKETHIAENLLNDNESVKKSYISCESAINDLPPLENNIGTEVQDYTMPPQNEYQKIMREKSSLIYNHIGTVHTERVKHIISMVPEGGNYKDLPPEYRNTRNFHVAWTRFASKIPAPTIDTGHRHHFHYKYNRVPTVRECARLQSFPDDFIFYGNKSQQYSQVGNAVPPLLAKCIAKELLEWL